ncbi:hypothetical protein MTO96_024670 [Rhipicephalus appendiculatus]
MLWESMGKYEQRSGAPRVLAPLLLLLLTLDAALCMHPGTDPSAGEWVQQNPSEPDFIVAAQFAERRTCRGGYSSIPRAPGHLRVVAGHEWLQLQSSLPKSARVWTTSKPKDM